MTQHFIPHPAPKSTNFYLLLFYYRFVYFLFLKFRRNRKYGEGLEVGNDFLSEIFRAIVQAER